MTEVWLFGMFLVAHALAVTLLPGHAMAASYVFLVAAPALACASVLWRCRRDGFAPARGWSLLAASMALWTLGMLASLRQDLFLDNANLAPGDSMLLYILYGVPITYAVATMGIPGESRLVRAIDALLAVALGGLYFGLTFSLTTVQGTDSAGSAGMVTSMFDLENAFLAVASLVRLRTAETAEAKTFFRDTAVFTVLYALVATLYNHWIASRLAPAFGTVYDVMVGVPFLVLAVLCLRRPALAVRRPASRAAVRFVRSGSPLMLALAVLVVSCMLMLRTRLYLGMAGAVCAVLGYGLRSILTQVRYIETGERLRDDRESLAHLVSRDGLTGLLNRRAFDQALEQAWNRAAGSGRDASLLVIDIDHFKQFNDRHGHQAGDECLREVALALQDGLRSQEVLARYGGEEFVVILPGAGLDEACGVADRLRADIEQKVRPPVDGLAHAVTLSIGVACNRDVAIDSAQALLAAADRALYMAKRGGRNRVERIAG